MYFFFCSRLSCISLCVRLRVQYTITVRFPAFRLLVSVLRAQASQTDELFEPECRFMNEGRNCPKGSRLEHNILPTVVVFSHTFLLLLRLELRSILRRSVDANPHGSLSRQSPSSTVSHLIEQVLRIRFAAHSTIMRFNSKRIQISESHKNWELGAQLTVQTSSGQLTKMQVFSMKWFSLLVGITSTLAATVTRFGQAPVGPLRWEPPLPFISSASIDASKLGPACIQQFPSELNIQLFNNPQDPPQESEDCLFLNVWAPANVSQNNARKPVVIWIYGGGLVFGTASIPEYDGMSLAKNQDIVVVSINYRTNVFGFPSSPDLPLKGNNLGFMDQELAMTWVQQNIANFGGDPKQVTIMGQSAGGLSVAAALVRHPTNAPFRAGILLSGVIPDLVTTPSFATFNQVAAAAGCNQNPGPARLACLKGVPATTIRAFINGPGALLSYGTRLVDNLTTFADSIERVRSGDAAQVPIFIGNTQDDGTLFGAGLSNLTAFLNSALLAPAHIPPDFLRSIYPGLNDSAVIAASLRDLMFTCPASLWASGYVEAGVSSVFRYEYGPVFKDMQLFPMAGAWHSSELPELFGTFNATTATPNEVTLSKTFQTAVANFIKNPNTSPAPNWPKYKPGSNTQTLARLAYEGNVELGNVVMTAESDSADAPCQVWNQFLDFN
ncbi:hypothetical protein D9758_011781 [Tetrapyrgos nigripes]|uniref:Carboxylic ester hydrolase n=1 Tax=Tetrapyrgos nigripes TaxID=182062 RepID=A0A8H5CWL8_9AGAR|nr:hypothetical protein D9758_011781 [Tetrapyrgos nigripes]